MGFHTLSSPNDPVSPDPYVKTAAVTDGKGTSLIKIMRQMAALMGGREEVVGLGIALIYKPDATACF